MSSSESRLRASAKDLSAELSVLDRTFATVANGVGEVEVKLPRGLYKLRLRLGTTMEEAHVVLDGSASRLIEQSPHVSCVTGLDFAEVQFGEVDFFSPIPLRGTTRAHEHHFRNAERISRQTTARLGSGSRLFIFSRAWSQQHEDGQLTRLTGWDPLADLALYDASGRRLFHLPWIAERDTSGDPWAGCNFEIAPGSYRLRREGAKVLEMPLFVPAGWQLQVFLVGSQMARTKSFSVDFGRAAVLLTRRSFDHDDNGCRHTEHARQGLFLRSSFVHLDDLRKSSFVRWDSPMLGIYQAHRLLLESERRDVALLRDVVHSLRSLVGSHPDVESIALACKMPVKDADVFRAPPMLAPSWENIVRASGTRPGLVPSDSPAAWIAPRLWTSGGPWLMASPIDDLIAAPIDSFFREQLSLAEARLWEFWRTQAPSRLRTSPTKAEVSAKTLVGELSLPASVILEAAIGLAHRLAKVEIPSNAFDYQYAASAIGMMTAGSAGASLSDEELLALSRQGNVNAFGKLIQRHEATVRALVQRIVRVDVEDVTQEVFMQAFRNMESAVQDIKPSTWLYALARRVAMKKAREHALANRVTRWSANDPSSSVRAPFPDPAASIDAKMLLRELDSALWDLTTDQRTIMVLRLMHDLLVSEIAEIVEQPVHDVSRQLRTATAKLRRRLSEVEPRLNFSSTSIRDLASTSLRRTSGHDFSVRVLTKLRRQGIASEIQPENPATSDALDLTGKVILEARHSRYTGTSPPYQSMQSRFSGRRIPDDDDRKRARTGGGRLIVENELDEEVYYVAVEDTFLDLPPDIAGQVIYVAIVEGRDGLMAGFARDYRGPYHTMGFSSKLDEDRSLLFTFALESSIRCIKCPQLAPSEAIDGVQYLSIPPIEAKYEVDVEFNDE